MNQMTRNAARPTPRFFSAFGTTFGQAGSLANQRKIDYNLNVELAEAACDTDAEVYVPISSVTTSTTSLFRYARLKADVEEAVKPLAFKHVVLLKPSLIHGRRADTRPVVATLKGLAYLMGRCCGNVLKDIWALDAKVIAKEAVHAGLQFLNGQAPADKVWAVQQADIIRLRRTEWKNVRRIKTG
ncbi:MAG: Protein fmp52, mitochondrial [Phylliscum demangeonii]|nr:MAG: Protein fmp52, mitochondrial [Phylliscum demangeonii]